MDLGDTLSHCPLECSQSIFVNNVNSFGLFKKSKRYQSRKLANYSRRSVAVRAAWAIHRNTIVCTPGAGMARYRDWCMSLESHWFDPAPDSSPTNVSRQGHTHSYSRRRVAVPMPQLYWSSKHIHCTAGVGVACYRDRDVLRRRLMFPNTRLFKSYLTRTAILATYCLQYW